MNIKEVLEYTQNNGHIQWNDPTLIKDIHNIGYSEFEFYITNYTYPEHGKIHGYFALLHNAVSRLEEDAVIVEIGNREGLSTLAICDALKPNQTFYTIDIAQDLRFLPPHFRDDKRIHILYGDCLSDSIINQIRDNSVDLLFSDTVHVYDQIKKEYEAYKGKLKDTAYLFVDDIKTNDKCRFYEEWSGERYNTDKWCHGPGGFGVFEYKR